MSYFLELREANADLQKGKIINMNIIAAIIIFSLVVIFHELGHFLLAKKHGITVTEFSVGMGPRIISKVKNGTRYSLKALPIGGSCMMLGEDEDLNDDNSFNSKSIGARISVIAAGPIFNFVLAFLLAILMLSIYGYDHAYVTNVAEGQPAEAAGLQVNDVITKVNGKSIHFGREIAAYFTFHELKAGDEVKIEYLRDGAKHSTTVVAEEKNTYLLGFHYYQDETAVAIPEVVSDGALDEAGIKANDVIVAINGARVKNGIELHDYFYYHPLDGSEIAFTYLRDGVENTVMVTPNYSTGYTVGFNYNYSICEKTGPIGVLKYSFYEVKYWISSTVQSLGQMIKGKVKADDLGGPVRIVSEIGKVIDSSKEYGFLNMFVNLVNWTILLSANLGVMNLLPIPALDGGRLIFLIIEGIRRKPIPRDKEAYINMAGFAMLMLLMVFVFYNDIKNILF